jgi:uncharacterized protein (TIGR03437 family)
LEDWRITSCIDDGAGNKDLRYGWWATTTALFDSVGHEEDVQQSARTIGQQFSLSHVGDRQVARVVSTASYAEPGRVAPNSLAAMFGSHFSEQTVTAASTVLPPELGDVQVRVRDATNSVRQCGPLFVSPGQINVLIPAAVGPGLAELIVDRAGQPLAAGQVMISSTAPAIFSANASGNGVAAATALRVRASGEREQVEVFHCSLEPVRCDPTFIDLGGEPPNLVVLTLYGTGLRGLASSGPDVRVSGRPVEVLYVGAQPEYPGLDQVNIVIPSSFRGAGEVSIQIEIDKLVSNTVTIALR